MPATALTTLYISSTCGYLPDCAGFDFSVGVTSLTGKVNYYSPGGGGGVTRDIYWCALAHQEKGVLGAGTTQKWGVLGAGTAPKMGGLRCGHNQKKGGLRHVYNPKKGEFRTDFVKRESVRNWSCSKRGLGSLFIYYLYVYLSIWSTSGGVFWHAEQGGS